MIEIFFEGAALGLALSILIGPVFFSLLQTSIKEGIPKALFMALGICLSDTFYIFLTYFGLSQFSENPNFIKYMGLGGGVILIITGFIALFKKTISKKEDLTIELSHKDRLKALFKGFSLNFINPAVFIFWVGVVGVVSLEYDYKNTSIALFFLGTVIMILLTDVLKVYVANNLSRILNDNILTWINRISGVLMIAFGLKLIIERVF